MPDILVRSAILRALVGALGGLLLVGGAFAAFSGVRVPGIAGAVVGGALTVCFMLAERRAVRGDSLRGDSTSAPRELWAMLDPREPVGPSGYEPGARVAAFVVLFALVLILLGEVGLPFVFGFIHGATGVPPTARALLLSWILIAPIASVIAGSTFVLIHRRAFLWREFQRILTASTIVTASAFVIACFRLGYSPSPGRESPDDVAWIIGYGIGALAGIVTNLFLITVISLALCGVSYVLVNAVSRSAFAISSAALEDDDPWPES